MSSLSFGYKLGDFNENNNYFGINDSLINNLVSTVW